MDSMYDKWVDKYKSREGSSYEEYREIIDANNLLIECINKGDKCIVNRSYDEAINVLNSGIDIGEQLRSNDNLIDEDELAKAYMNRGVAYEYFKEHEKALSNKNKSVEMLERINSEGNLHDKNLLALAYMNRAQTYSSMQRYDMDITDTIKSIEIWEQMKEEGNRISENFLALAYANKSMTESKIGNSSHTNEDDVDMLISGINNSIKTLKNTEGNNVKELVSLNTLRGMMNFQNARYLESINDFNVSIEIAEGTRESDGQYDVNDLAQAYAGIGLSYHMSGNNHLAIPNLKKGIALWEQLQNEGKYVDESLLYLAQSIISSFINETYDNMDEAIAYSLKSMETADRLGVRGKNVVSDNLATNHMILGVSCDQKEEFIEANKHYSDCIDILEELSDAGEEIDKSHLALAYMNRGSNYYHEMDEIDKALFDYNKAINIMEQLQKEGKQQDISDDMFMLYKNRSQAYEADGDINNAIKDIISAMQILKGEFAPRLEFQSLYYTVLGELIELIGIKNDRAQMQEILQEFLYSMRQVPKTQEAEALQNNILISLG